MRMMDRLWNRDVAQRRRCFVDTSSGQLTVINNYLFSENLMEESQRNTAKDTDETKKLSYKDILSGIQKQMNSATASDDMNSVLMNASGASKPEIITTKRFMPDGTILITTKKDGKIVEQHKKKPHLVPVPDGLTGEVKLEPFQSIFELMA